MGLARTHAVALLGIDGALVEVEAHVGTGLPKFALVGLPDTALSEARDRVRAAIVNAGYPFPDTKLTVALSPATLPKAGSHFDLAIAAAIVAAGDHKAGAASERDPTGIEEESGDPGDTDPQGGQPVAEASPSAGSARSTTQLLTPEQVADTVFIGELGLDGRVRPVRGLLPLVLAATRAGRTRVMVPAANAAEAALVEGVEAIGVHHLRQLVAYLAGEDLGSDAPVRAVPAATRRPESAPGPDLADVRGQAQARFGLEVAAAGGHHLLLIGPPGAGKTMLATRLPGLLPELDLARALEVTAVHSLAGTLDGSAQLIRQPPFVDPHHTATVASLIGGGSRLARPGAVSLAHGGVLFLDEAPEFRPAALEALRQPMEGGEVLIARAAGVARYPAAFQLVLAANPCPCGQAGTRSGCTCPPQSRARYLARLSGPVRDRIDISWQMQPVSRADLLAELGEPEASAPVAARVLAARDRQRVRFGRSVTNAAVPAALLRRHHPPDLPGRSIVERAVGRGLLSARGADKVVRIAWTVADLRGLDRPGISECAIALTLRLGEATDGLRSVPA
jgi:magnesium chelatase family protein